MGIIKNLKRLWQRYSLPDQPKKRKETPFGEAYYAMLAMYKTLDSVERDRIEFFVAARADEGPAKDYIEYVHQLRDFCDFYYRNPDSVLARGLHEKQIAEFSRAVMQMMNAIRISDKPYLDRVRAQIPVPVNDEMIARVRRNELAMLREDVLVKKIEPS